MKIFGVVCEYNPFHTGHLHQLTRTRELLGEDALCIAVMSGDFVQRGEAAQFSKFARAEAACRCGADLVFELPVRYALSSAEGFARGAAAMLSALGCEYISFGSESADTDAMYKIARELLKPETQQQIRELLKKDGRLSYAAAREKLLKDKLGAAGECLSCPNDILGIEYIKALLELDSPMKPIAVKRVGAGHDAPGGDGFRSASALREMLDSGEDVSEYIPPAAMEIFKREMNEGRMKNSGNMELLILSRLRMLNEADFEALPDAQGGAGQRLYKAVRENGSLDGIAADASGKRYTAARMRRMCLCAALSIKADCTKNYSPLARLLAANRRGCAYLSKAENLPIQILSKPAAVKQMPEKVQSVFASGAYAHDLYCLQFADAEDRKSGGDWKTSPIIV